MLKITLGLFLGILLSISPAGAAQLQLKICDMPAVTSLQATDYLEISRNCSGSMKVTAPQIASYVLSNAPGSSGQFLFNSGGSIAAIGLAPVATSGIYSDLTGKPSIPTLVSQLTNDSGYLAPSAIGSTVQAHNATLDNLSAGALLSTLKVNRNAASLPAAQTGTLLQVGNVDGTASRIESDSFSASSYFTSVRPDGTAASPTAVQSGDELGGYNAWGYNGVAVVGPQSSFRSLASQTWTTSARGTYAAVAVTPNGTTTMADVVHFENDGGLTVPPAVTGGDKGTGTINAAGLYVNGVSVVTPGAKATFTKQQNFSTATLTDGATIPWDLDVAQVAKVTLAGNRTVAAPTNMVDGGNYLLRIYQDGTGSRTLTWNAVFKWPSGTAPTLSTGAGKLDLLSCTSDGTSMFCVTTLDVR